jgi:hypothetical protein
MWGLGDSIYARPFIAAASMVRDVWLETPWPELYADLPLRFVKGDRPLRTQTLNAARQPPGLWRQPPAGAQEIRLAYGNAELARGSVVQGIESKLPLPAGVKPVWTLPELGASPIDTRGSPLAIIRPVTRRAEWDNRARNCLPGYVDEIAGDLKGRGFSVLVLADLKVGEEWLENGRIPPSNAALTNGELSMRQMLAAVRDAAVVVGPVGWIVPAGLALGTRTFCVLGGQGGHNAPEKLTDPRMDCSRLGFAMPKEFCRCTDMQHSCPKAIPDLMSQWSDWRRNARFRFPRSSAHSQAGRSPGGQSSVSATTRQKARATTMPTTGNMSNMPPPALGTG